MVSALTVVSRGVVIVATEYPATQPVTLYRMEEGENGMGDPVHTWPYGESVNVIGWYVTGGTETAPNGHVYAVDYDAAVLAPAGLNVGLDDRIELPGVGIFDIDGAPANWDNGPWWNPKARQIKLKRRG